MYRKKKKDNRFDSIINKEIVIIDAESYHKRIKEASTEIVKTFSEDFGINIENYKDIIDNIIVNSFDKLYFNGESATCRVNDIVILPYKNFAGKINIETSKDFDILSDALKLASEIKK